MKIGKRLLSVVLAVLMLASCLSVCAFAAEPAKEPRMVLINLPLFDFWDPASLDACYQEDEDEGTIWCYPGWDENAKSTCISLWVDYDRPFYIFVADRSEDYDDDVYLAPKKNRHLHVLTVEGFKSGVCEGNNVCKGAYVCKDCEQRYPFTLFNEHILGVEILRKEGSCTEGAVWSRYCARCGQAVTRIEQPYEHALYKAETVAPTCGTRGYDKYYCWNCDKVFMDNFVDATNDHKDKNNDGKCDFCGTQLRVIVQQTETKKDLCPYCGEEHTGTFAWLVKIFHNIAYIFAGKKK